MKKTTLIGGIVLCCMASLPTKAQLSAYDLNCPIGWATVDGEITGGDGGDEVVVTNEQEFEDALNKNAEGKTERDAKRIIYLKGDIKFTQLHTFHVQNKTILGLPGSRLYNENRTKKNGGLVKFTSGSENIIIRNVTIEGPGAYDVDGEDALLFQECKRMWVDHCDILDGLDSSFDCNNGSDYISVTWTRFRYLKDPLAGGSGGANDHRFCNTWGASDKNANKSAGKLNTTFANCWWGEGVMERAPRVRFGKVHVINCYYTNTGNHYSLGYGYMSNIYAEKCWFAEGVISSKNYTDAKHGYADYNFQVIDCHGAEDVKEAVGDAAYFNPDDYYNYEGFDKELVPTVVGDLKTGAGAHLMVEIGKGVTGYVGESAPTEISSALSQTAQIVNTVYYNATGTRFTVPQRGVNIVRQLMSDGSTRTVKITK